MFKGWYRSLSLLAILAASAMATQRANSGDLFFLNFLQRQRPPVCKDADVESLAQQIDYLEAQIETYGTIVPKQPDIWGEARLTRHRQEVERELAGDLSGFRETLNASIRRSDQSFLGAAMTISAAAQGSEGAPSSDALTNTLNLVAVPEGAIQRTGPNGLPRGNFVTSLGPEEKKFGGVSLEPTVVLEQKFRYLNLLNELRRINEGDDTADSPGYALNLVRIPVSVLPGKKTRSGFGAEITITARPHLTPELLPTTFRSLVINDVVDFLALPTQKALDHEDEELILPLRNLVNEQYKNWRVRTENIRRLNGNGEISPFGIGPTEELNGGDADPIQRELVRNAEQLVLKSGILDFTGSLVTGRSTRPMLPFPPAHMLDIFGTGTVLAPVIFDSTRALGRHPVHAEFPHLPDVEAFLRGELEAAYEFLSRPETEFLWHQHCTAELVEAIRQRRRFITNEDHYLAFKYNIDAVGQSHRYIRKLRHAFFDDIALRFPRATFTTTTSLAWAIIVDAALLNDRLMEDMRLVAAEKGVAELAALPAWLDFYAPNPSPFARFAFTQYVAARWPVQVFALDPVNDEQNVADVFSMRREMQMAAAAGLASGNISANAAFRFVRRLEMDIETIALNRKTVAFAHGNDTFGWRFYPRIQTPPTVNNSQAFLQTLMGGPSNDWIVKQRQLESGSRELTAVVLMPSFVPHLIFETRANWFKLTNPRHKELTLHDAMKISRTWQSVRTAAPQICNAHCYRAEDISWLSKSVDQIERRLPLQSMMVPIPYENTLGGFEMFNSGITDLAPSLSGWYGAPGITILDPVPGCWHAPSSNNTAAASANGTTAVQASCNAYESTASDPCRGTCDGTTLFLVGNGFSVRDTQVIAGGRCVPFQLMSRQIMRVTIPPNVHTLPEEVDGRFRRLVVDVHVATPYGVSNHLLVNAVRPEIPSPPSPTLGYFWSDRSAKHQATVCPRSAQPYFELQFNSPLENPRIVNRSGSPTPPVGAFQGVIVAELATGNKTLGQTNVYHVIRDDNHLKQDELVIKTPDGHNSLAVDIRRLVESLGPTEKPNKLVIVGFLRFQGCEQVKLKNELVIELTHVPCCTTSDQHLEHEELFIDPPPLIEDVGPPVPPPLPSPAPYHGHDDHGARLPGVQPSVRMPSRSGVQPVGHVATKPANSHRGAGPLQQFRSQPAR